MGSPLSSTNRYLRDPELRKQELWISAKTSSAIEGIREPFAKAPVGGKRVKTPTARRDGAKSARSRS